MSTYDLIDINEVKSYLSITDADISENAISLYCYDSDATAATAEVIFSDVYAQSLSLVITGGNQAGTITYDLDSLVAIHH